jgi:hypothetical protein
LGTRCENQLAHTVEVVHGARREHVEQLEQHRDVVGPPLAVRDEAHGQLAQLARVPHIDASVADHARAARLVAPAREQAVAHARLRREPLGPVAHERAHQLHAAHRRLVGRQRAGNVDAVKRRHRQQHALAAELVAQLAALLVVEQRHEQLQQLVVLDVLQKERHRLGREAVQVAQQRPPAQRGVDARRRPLDAHHVLDERLHVQIGRAGQQVEQVHDRRREARHRRAVGGGVDLVGGQRARFSSIFLPNAVLRQLGTSSSSR